MSDPLYAEDEDQFVDELKPGTELMHGQYTIECFLAAGGFGITYLAKDSLERPVVIKECFPNNFCRRQNHSVLPRSRAHQNDLQSIVRLFSQEAMSLSKAGHPNVVGVHQVFEENNTAYMALDYVEGKDLLAILTETPEELTPEKISGYLLAMLGAIGHVHAQGILHRDISPDNIIINNRNQPVLIDFGAARQEAGKASRLLTALRVVKDGYSPQEFYIAGSDQGPSCDLYSLAASFYHLITGNLPPDSQSRLTAFAANEEDPYVPLASLDLGYPRKFSAALDKAMSLLPKDRMQSAEQWLDYIDGKVDHKLANTESSRAITERPKKKSALPLVIGSLALATAAGVGIAFLSNSTAVDVALDAQETAAIALPSELTSPVDTAETANTTFDTADSGEALDVLRSAVLLADDAQSALPAPEQDNAPTFEASDLAALFETAETEAVEPVQVEPAVQQAITTAVTEVVTPTSEEFDGFGIMEVEKRSAPFVLSSETPGVVASVAANAPDWLTVGVQIATINGKQFSTNEAALDEVDNAEGDVVSIGVDTGADTGLIERPVVVETVVQTFLQNGLTFSTTMEDRKLVTRVTEVPAGSTFRPGDVIFAYVNTGERLGRDITIKSILERELEAGTTNFSFAVEREGEVWVEAFQLASLID